MVLYHMATLVTPCAVTLSALYQAEPLPPLQRISLIDLLSFMFRRSSPFIFIFIFTITLQCLLFECVEFAFPLGPAPLAKYRQVKQ